MTGAGSDRPRALPDPAALARRRDRRRRLQRRRLRRRRWAAAFAAAAAIGLAVALAEGLFSGHKAAATARVRATHAGPPVARSSPAAGGSGAAPAPRAHPAAKPGATAHAAPSPGSLPQTHAYPTAHGDAFRSRIDALWAGIERGAVRPALPAFFPKGAYSQLKAVADAGSDWTDRLVHDYALDISAAHALVAGGPGHATLVGVRVDPAFGHWIEPGVCDNGIGYYEMPGARILYRRGGAIHSFGIASMISWRGQWYVVHLGAVLRSAEGGVVDEPASGPGTPAYSGTC